MNRSTALVLLLALLGSAAAVELRMHEALVVPRGWRRVGDADDSQMLRMTVAVKQQNVQLLEETLLAVSDPDSPRYGQHLTFEQVNELTAPTEENMLAVLGWLETAGVSAADVSASTNGDFIHARVSVAQAEVLLSTQFATYEHGSAPGKLVTRAASDYLLPAAVSAAVDFVAPTVRFPTPFTMAQSGQWMSEAAQPPKFGGDNTPAALRKLYGVGNVQATSTENLQGVAQFLGQYYSPSDLSSFFNSLWKPAIGRKVAQVVGPNQASNPGTEASLDIEYIMAMGSNVTTYFYYTPGNAPHNDQNEPFLTWLTTVADEKRPPFVLSTSYGDVESSVSLTYADRINTEFKKLGSRGISLLYASGDSGVGSGCTQFAPGFPADSPWVTGVGGTRGQPEQADTISGGGFSNYFGRPAYQDAAAKHYFATASNLPSSNLYNASGAGFPDVAAQSEGYPVVVDGFTEPVAGTSCACPCFSGIVSLLNDLRFNAGKAPLGFLNPLFYKNPSMFNDITQGSNPGCGTNGFPAAAGWDPVTGLGTANYPKMVDVVKALA
eukprot:PLAT13725.4.p1 GENE.PLAT13725.4~~PLAT13725.4.p1  ORF type:complete len:551 (-),score=292.13 PLAT13725.4:810-2462(-)